MTVFFRGRPAIDTPEQQQEEHPLTPTTLPQEGRENPPAASGHNESLLQRSRRIAQLLQDALQRFHAVEKVLLRDG